MKTLLLKKYKDNLVEYSETVSIKFILELNI